mmetsp:Transcript_573/g.2337  ORF Transcript_573/g.2337 Transcript_573/m.2337 type:complete len:228 (-) Transcript_573:92-775(-)
MSMMFNLFVVVCTDDAFSCSSANSSSAVLYSRFCRRNSLRFFHIDCSLARLASSRALVMSSTSISSSLASPSSSSRLLDRVGSFTFSLKLLKPIPIFFGLNCVSNAREIPLAPLPKPSPFLYPIFSKSFIPIPFVCFSNEPTSSFARLLRPPPSLRELVPAKASSLSLFLARAAFSSARRFAAFALRSSSAIFARCAAPATNLCPNVDGNKSSSSSSSSSSLTAPSL